MRLPLRKMIARERREHARPAPRRRRRDRFTEMPSESAVWWSSATARHLQPELRRVEEPGRQRGDDERGEPRRQQRLIDDDRADARGCSRQDRPGRSGPPVPTPPGPRRGSGSAGRCVTMTNENSASPISGRREHALDEEAEDEARQQRQRHADRDLEVEHRAMNVHSRKAPTTMISPCAKLKTRAAR